MGQLKGVVVLPVDGGLTQVIIDTNITADSTTGWEITGFRGWMRSRNNLGVEIPESNVIDLILSTQPAIVTVPSDVEEIARVSWALAFSSGVGFTSTELNKASTLGEPRLTVQPLLYVSAQGSTTIGSITDLYYEIDYQQVKLGAVELLRLLVGGV